MRFDGQFPEMVVKPYYVLGPLVPQSSSKAYNGPFKSNRPRKKSIKPNIGAETTGLRASQTKINNRYTILLKGKPKKA